MTIGLVVLIAWLELLALVGLLAFFVLRRDDRRGAPEEREAPPDRAGEEDAGER